MKRDWQSCAQATRGCGYGDGAVVKTSHWHTENPSKGKRGLGTPDRLRRISRPASKNASLFWFKPPAYKVRLRFNSQRKKTKKTKCILYAQRNVSYSILQQNPLRLKKVCL